MNLTVPLVDLQAQWAIVGDQVQAAMLNVCRTASFILGPDVEAFETDFARYCEAEHCVGVASGTDAIQLMLRGLGIGPGDEVIIPAFTFVATALGVTLAGATPVLADVQRDDALLDCDAVAARITPRTKAILAVHLYGRSADMGRLGRLAQEHGILLLEDAAQAHGATYRDRKCGALGHAAAFSFYPGKNLGAYGDAGAITTNDSELVARLRLLRNWGSRKKYHHEEIGLNSRLDSLQAAVLRTKLPYLDQWNAARKRHAARYMHLLMSHGDYRWPQDGVDGDSACHLFVLRLPNRDQVLEHLNRAGIQAAIHYPFPVHQLLAYRHLAAPMDRFPEAEAWARECLSLPLYPELTDEAQDYVVRHLCEAIDR